LGWYDAMLIGQLPDFRPGGAFRLLLPAFFVQPPVFLDLFQASRLDGRGSLTIFLAGCGLALFALLALFELDLLCLFLAGNPSLQQLVLE
jgi:hypothetical protein